MAYAEKRGKGPRPWRVRYKIPGGEDTQSGFETKKAALEWGRDQEAKIRTGTWTDPAAGEITVSEWIGQWTEQQDVGPRTTVNRDYLLRRFILPYWGGWKLNEVTGGDITIWEKKLPAEMKVSRGTAKDARSLLHTILGDAAAAKPPLIPFNPAVRPRNRGRRTGRRLDQSPQRAWATPLQVLLVAERAALLAGRDDELTMILTIAYTGMRWGETIGLETSHLLPALINVEWQLEEISGRFHRLPPKDDSYRSTNWEPLLSVDIPPFLSALLAAQAQRYAQRRCACADAHDGTGQYVFLGPDGGHHRNSNYARRVFRPRLRRPPPARQRQARSARSCRRHGMAGHPGRLLATSGHRQAVHSPGRTGNTTANRCGRHGTLRNVRARRPAAARRQDDRPQDRRRALLGQRRAARREPAARQLATGQTRTHAPRPAAQPQDLDGRGRHP
jgi:hypothetical protein